jgi:hypothetical protein
MQRINPVDLGYLIDGALWRAGREVGNPLRKADAAVIRTTREIVLKEVFRDEAVLVRPDKILVPLPPNVFAGSPRHRPGSWGPDDPLPGFSNDPPPPRRDDE